ncbi:hypothetical protein L195_g026831 [Trifolium pratense]|uniref:Uncharacterized protein n=1 Tax=Trifolium pratense TaxID=57577 RepID=A0A2K3NKI3_TRIPR|nr:hypothetical protein L195_g026831 [Trifolium pratense]
MTNDQLDLGMAEMSVGVRGESGARLTSGHHRNGGEDVQILGICVMHWFIRLIKWT